MISTERTKVLLDGSAPQIPSIDVTEIRWITLKWNKAEAVTNMTLTNQNCFDFDMIQFGFELWLGNSRVSDLAEYTSTRIAAGETCEYFVPLEFVPANLGFLAYSQLKSETIDYGLDGVVIQKTPAGSREIPFKTRGSVLSKEQS
jgi:hypothetical protein